MKQYEDPVKTLEQELRQTEQGIQNATKELQDAQITVKELTCQEDSSSVHARQY